MTQNQKDLRIRSVRERKNLVKRQDFAKVLPPIPGFGTWFQSLPDIYGGKALKTLVQRVVEARKAGREVGLSLGAHVLKVGLAPLLIDLMQRGFISHVSTNGAGAIHDWETAFMGETSEDVAANLGDGSFGFWRETFAGINGACVRAASRGEGLGQALGRSILEDKLPHADLSMFAQAAKLNIPATIHAAIGCDIVHMDPALDGAALGKSSLQDFWILADTVGRLSEGVWINIGSAVIMPEVFLKAVSIARNRGTLGKDFTTANLDMIAQYRSMTNVVQRPPREGLSIIGQHEVLLPLLHQAILAVAGVT